MQTDDSDSSVGPYDRLWKYPEDIFGSPTSTSSDNSRITDVLIPLSVCISLGPYNAVLIMNNLVLGGWVLGRIATVIKHVIEISKMAELKGLAWGRSVSHSV